MFDFFCFLPYTPVLTTWCYMQLSNLTYYKIYWMPNEITHFCFFLVPVSMLLGFHQNLTYRVHAYCSIPLTHVRSIWPNKWRSFRLNVVMQFSHANLVQVYWTPGFQWTTSYTPCWYKKTQTASNMPRLSENQRIESLWLLATDVSATGVMKQMNSKRRTIINL